MFFINPFIYGGAGGDFESIATVTVSSGGASSIEFTSIPGTYQHLQVRMLCKNSSTSIDSVALQMELNGDTGFNYARHFLAGNGSTAYAGSTTSASLINMGGVVRSPSGTTSMFTALIVDILDYASTSKNKTTRHFNGWDTNNVGTGVVIVSSGLWMSTSAVTSIKLTGSADNFIQHSTAALYGIKAP